MTTPAPRLPPTLVTARLVLRALRHADAPGIFTIFSDRAVARYWSRPAMTGITQARRLVSTVRAGYHTGDSMSLGIERADTHALVGTCTLFAFHATNRRAEIGYALASSQWGHGYMDEALVRFVNYAFDELDLHRLEADIDPANTASERTLLRLGFVREGRLRERWIVGDTISDSAVYGLLRREWMRGGPVAAAATS